jgi:hypothetical protein
MIDPTSRSARRLWGFGDLGGAGHAHGRWPVECRAGGVEWWPVHRRIACPAGPSGVSADVAEAGLMADEDLPGAELVAVGAAGLTRQADHPLPAPDHGTQGNAPVHNG